MKRRDFLSLLPLLTSSACGLARIDAWHPYVRSDVVMNPEDEKRVLSKAKIGRTSDGAIRVAWLQGTGYERGYQQGKLLQKEVTDNLGYIYEKAYGIFRFEELFDEAYERMRPFIPQEYVDEMHGLAHGSRMPLRVIQAIHMFPSIGEWGGKKHIKKIIKEQMAGTFATTCSNFMAGNSATSDGKMYVVRILDWGMHRISKLHQYPLIAINKPDHGYASANIGWVGFLGAVSGINEQGITLGEMGYGDPENETLRGMPMIFLLRDVLKRAGNLSQTREIIKNAVGTNSFVYIMSDGKTKEAEMYVRDRDRFKVAGPGQRVLDGEYDIPGIPDVVYGGAFVEKMTKLLTDNRGNLTPEMIMKSVIPEMVMRSNFQNVLYSPEDLSFWVNNAFSRKTSAKNRPYSFFNFGEALEKFPKATEL